MSTGHEGLPARSMAFGHLSFTGGQSGSFELLHMAGQKPSDTHWRGVRMQTMLHGPASPPLRVAIVLASETQVAAVSQLPSQVSGGSMTPLPHTGEQLLSL